MGGVDTFIQISYAKTWRMDRKHLLEFRGKEAEIATVLSTRIFIDCFDEVSSLTETGGRRCGAEKGLHKWTQDAEGTDIAKWIAGRKRTTNMTN